MDLVAEISSILKKEKKTVSDTVKAMGIGRNTFYYQLKDGSPSEEFISDFKKATGIDITVVLKQRSTLNDSGGFNTPFNSAAEPEPEVYKPNGQITTLKQNRRTSKGLIPFYNADFMAGNAEAFYEDGTIHPEYFMDVPEFAGCTAFRNYGDSMEPKIRSGAILFGNKIDDWQDHLEYGQIYGITCTDRRRYLKYIRRAENNNRIFILKSENPNYDDFELPKTKIKNIWLIEGWLDKRT